MAYDAVGCNMWQIVSVVLSIDGYHEVKKKKKYEEEEK